MEIQLEGEYSKKDLRRIVRGRFGRIYAALAVGAGAMAVMNLAFLIQVVLAGPLEPMALLFAALPSIVLFAIAAGLGWGLPWLTVRQLAKLPLFQGKITGAVTDETLTLNWAQGEVTVRWELFQYYKMWDDMVVLYENPSTITPLPRGLFAGDDDWQRLRQFIQDTVPAKPVKSGPFLLRWPGRLLIYLILLLIIGALAFVFASTH